MVRKLMVEHGGRGLCLMRTWILRGLVSRPRFLKSIVIANRAKEDISGKEAGQGMSSYVTTATLNRIHKT